MVAIPEESSTISSSLCFLPCLRLEMKSKRKEMKNKICFAFFFSLHIVNIHSPFTQTAITFLFLARRTSILFIFAPFCETVFHEEVRRFWNTHVARDWASSQWARCRVYTWRPVFWSTGSERITGSLQNDKKVWCVNIGVAAGATGRIDVRASVHAWVLSVHRLARVWTIWLIYFCSSA